MQKLIKRSTIQLLRFHFSYFLMPVYWFALSFVHQVNWINAILIFFIIHVLVYPSSNGYNSFMDRDEESIGGIKNPLLPTRQLFYVSIMMDVIAIVFSLLISLWFTVGILIYIICSRLYSFRRIRLKRFAIIGYLIVILNQGALTFCMIYHGASTDLSWKFPLYGVLAATFLIGGFYPITQIYQHEADAKDGVKTMSMLLGKTGTFIFSAVMYLIAFGLLFYYFKNRNELEDFIVLQLFFLPVIVFFIQWFLKVLKNKSEANFKNTMRMNWIASTCTNLAFITLLILHQS